MKRTLALILAVTFGIWACVASKAEAGTDYPEIRRQLAEDVKKLRIPGMAVVVVDSEKVLFAETFGDCESIDTPFIIGSISKSFTALSIMKLAEEGKINLDAPIADYLDAASYLKNPSDGEKITVKQLLNHTSGLGAYQRFGDAKITEAYGKYQYANVNYGILGKIIETVSGEIYADFLDRIIFKPLRMNHSAATLEKSKENGLIKGYRNYFGLPVPGELDYPNENSWSTVPAGYISASAADMGKYMQLYLNHGMRIISQSSIDAMFYDSVPQDESGFNFYGLGWMRSNQYSRPVIMHAGLVENYAANIFIIPSEGLGIVFLINMNDYLVANRLLENISMPLLGEPKQEIPNDAYFKFHLFTNLIYLGIFIISLIPALFIGRWKRKRKTKIDLLYDIPLHIVLPLVLLATPYCFGVPPWVVWRFVKDLSAVLIVSATILLATGTYKLIFIHKERFLPAARPEETIHT